MLRIFKDVNKIGTIFEDFHTPAVYKHTKPYNK